MDPQRAETHLRLIAEAQLRLPPPRGGSDTRAERVWFAATTLTAAGALDVEPAHRAVADFEAATALRPGAALSRARYAERPLWTALRPPEPPLRAADWAAGLPLDPATALVIEDAGRLCELRPLGLVSSDRGMALSLCLRWLRPGASAAAGGRTRPPERPPQPALVVADDLGTAYRVRWPGAWPQYTAHGGRWDVQLAVTPALPARARLLSVGGGPGSAALEIPVQPVPRVSRVGTQPAAGGVGERMLDAAARELLLAPPEGRRRAAERTTALRDTLVGAGVLDPPSPAAARLAALGRRLGLELGEHPGSDALPRSWQDVLASRDAHDGPEALAGFAVPLPPLDGAGFAVNGLRSTADALILHLYARGWQPRGPNLPSPGADPVDLPPDPSVALQCRDDTGRWHLTESTRWWFADGAALIEARLTPPLHPAASALEVTVTGRAEQAGATVTLPWRGAET